MQLSCILMHCIYVTYHIIYIKIEFRSNKPAAVPDEKLVGRGADKSHKTLNEDPITCRYNCQATAPSRNDKINKFSRQSKGTLPAY